jgi:acyl-coenzyme A synthetase/AMP-(fatty) acid ligase
MADRAAQQPAPFSPKRMNYQQLYDRSIEQREDFWREQAERIRWFRPPEQILSQDDDGFYHWYRGGRLNTAYLALDYQLEQGRGDQPALIYDSPVTGTQQVLTYRELHAEVARFAGGLRQLGVEKGHTVVIYMPMIPQTVVAMLACARIGAIHSVVFGGFAPRELAIRIDDARPDVLLTASAGKERDRVIDYLEIVDAALEQAENPPHTCVVYQRPFHRVELRPERDRDWEEFAAAATPCDWLEMDATDPLYILYTSGTTGRPKGILRDHGGHAVAMQFSMRTIYDARPGEVFWAASDVGWVVGHSYIVYGPLIHGCTSILYEGKPVGTPDAGAFWRVIAEHQVRSMFTAPTAIRAVKREDPEGQMARRHDLSCLRYLFLAGERCDVATLEWATDLLGVPVIDHWWQTESGWPMLANMAGVELLPIKPGSAGKPVCGYDLRVLDAQSRELPAGQEGTIAVRMPLPPGCLPNLWRNPERFRRSYLEQFPGYFLSGDGGYRDEDGYFYITGRLDDIINVAGHRLSTSTMEEVVASHPAVAECAVIGVADQLKGQVPVGFVVVKADAEIDDDELERQLVGLVREKVGAVASFKRALIARRLPKTRSGKILRRVMRSIADGEPYSAPSTIEEPAALTEIAEAMREHNIGANK